MDSVLTSLQESFQSFSTVIALAVLAAYFVVDAMYAHYTISVAELRPFPAANTGSLIHFLLALGVLSYVQNYLYIIPIAIGSWFGTFYIVSKRRKQRNI